MDAHGRQHGHWAVPLDFPIEHYSDTYARVLKSRTGSIKSHTWIQVEQVMLCFPSVGKKSTMLAFEESGFILIPGDAGQKPSQEKYLDQPWLVVRVIWCRILG